MKPDPNRERRMKCCTRALNSPSNCNGLGECWPSCCVRAKPRFPIACAQLTIVGAPRPTIIRMRSNEINCLTDGAAMQSHFSVHLFFHLLCHAHQLILDWHNWNQPLLRNSSHGSFFCVPCEIWFQYAVAGITFDIAMLQKSLARI